MSAPEFHILMQRLLDDETLTPEDFTALENELLNSSAAREQWRELARLHNALEIRCASQVAVDAVKIVPIDRILANQRKKIAKISSLAAAAVILISAIVMWSVMASESSPIIAKLSATPGSVFSLVHPEGSPANHERVLLEGSTLELTHGAAELRLPHDVRALVEAPAQITLIDDRTLHLDHGRAFFEISTPAGKGFTVVTPQQRIVDLGTAFGIETQQNRSTVELHVLEGKVRVDHRDGTAGETLAAPRSVLLDATRVSNELEPTHASFLRQLPDTVKTLLVEDFETGLVPGNRYAVFIDSSLVRDSDGKTFAGLSDPSPWSFQTELSNSLKVRNPSFEEDQKVVVKGRPIKHWSHALGDSWGWGTDRTRYDLKPTEGEFFGRLFGGRTIHQDTEEIITAGTTYVLTMDIAEAQSGRAVFDLFGSDRSHTNPLATASITIPSEGWLRDQSLVFTATDAHATGQTLGIALHAAAGTAMFDRIRLQAFPANQEPSAAPLELSQEKPPASLPAQPTPIAFHPAPGSTIDAPVGELSITFDRPIRLGTGRVTLLNLDNGEKVEIVSGSPRLQISDHTLVIYPPLKLADGASFSSTLPHWHSETPVVRINPAGDGTRYSREKLADTSRPRGVIDSMRGPHIISIYPSKPGAGIRRTVTEIAPNLRYTASVAIGHRASDAIAVRDFSGCTLRLVSGEVILATQTILSPPSSPNQIETVGISWNSSELPDGIALGDPLVLEIATGNSANLGYLDIDHVHVTAVPLRD